MATPVPFTIHFGAHDRADLVARLTHARWPERETVDDWSQGVPLAYLREVCEHWADGYDFDAAAARCNAHPHYRIDIDGLGIHYLHARSPHPGAVPLLLTHGWPGSFVEFLGVIDALVDPDDPADAFEVIVPSLPGYGFSEKPARTGWGVDRIADAWHALALALGHDRYAVQGGDWGAIVSDRIATRHPDHVLGLHSNMPVVALTPEDTANATPDEQRYLAAMAEHQRSGRGYSEEQSTRPQTIGYALTDSPVALCAWILEKFWSWTDNDGHPEHALTKDQMLDNISVYWFSGTGASAARLYWESLRSVKLDPITVPSGVSVFPREIFPLSKRWCEKRYLDLRHYGLLDRGGHFAAFEQPERFVDELRTFFRTVR